MPQAEAPAPQIAGGRTDRQLRARRVGAEERVSEAWDACNAARRNVDDPRRIERWSEAIESLYDALLPWTAGDDDFEAEWQMRPLAVVYLEDGGEVPMPTASDCREAHQILVRAMHKAHLLVKERVVSGPGKREYGKPSVQVEADAAEVQA